MSKFWITFIAVIVLGAALSKAGKSFRQSLKDSATASVQMDTDGARKAIKEMDRYWSQAAAKFAEGDFAQCQLQFDAGFVPLQIFTAQFGDQNFADGKTLRAWLKDHEASWIATLSARRADVVRAWKTEADLGALVELKQRFASAEFNKFTTSLCGDLATQAASHDGVLVIEPNSAGTLRRERMTLLARLRPQQTDLFLIFGPADEVGKLPPLKYLGLIRATFYEEITYYSRDNANLTKEMARRNNGAGNVATVSLVQKIHLLLEPDRFVQENFGFQRKVCATDDVSLPQTFDVGESTGPDYADRQRTKVLGLLAAKMPPLDAPKSSHFGFCALEPMTVSRSVPLIFRDSAVLRTYPGAR